MGFVEDTLSHTSRDSIRSIALPRRTAYYPSPGDWRSQMYRITREWTRHFSDSRGFSSRRIIFRTGIDAIS